MQSGSDRRTYLLVVFAHVLIFHSLKVVEFFLENLNQRLNKFKNHCYRLTPCVALSCMFSFPSGLFGCPSGLFGYRSGCFGCPSGFFGYRSDCFECPSGLFGRPSDFFGCPSGLFGYRSGCFGCPSGFFGYRSDCFECPSGLFGRPSDFFGCPSRLFGLSCNPSPPSPIVFHPFSVPPPPPSPPPSPPHPCLVSPGLLITSILSFTACSSPSFAFPVFRICVSCAFMLLVFALFVLSCCSWSLTCSSNFAIFSFKRFLLKFACSSSFRS